MDLFKELIFVVCLLGVSHEYMPYNPYSPVPRDETQFGCGTPPDSCPETKYRSYDGSCNNLLHPVWGMPQVPYQRLLNASYEDGVNQPVLSQSGKPLTNARTISALMYPDFPKKSDPKYSLAAMQYGQIITHDISLSALRWTSNELCCSPYGIVQKDPGTHPKTCMPIIFPYNVNNESTTRCMDFNRTITTLDRGCSTNNETANQITTVTGYLDLSIVYGSTDIGNKMVRKYSGGRLKVAVRDGYQWPTDTDPTITEFTCQSQTATAHCYLGGDIRVDQNPELIILQIVWHREHNRLADGLAKLNPHWDDETIFQEARRIAIAEHQQITYYEWMPVYFGYKISKKYKLIYNTPGYVDDYSEDVNPIPANEYAIGALRYFHAAIVGELNLACENRKINGTLRLSTYYRRSDYVEDNNIYDNIIRGFTNQPQNEMKTHHTKEITDFLFPVQYPFLNDLKSIDIQRGRDHGLPSYNNMRQYCGLPKAKTFEDFSDVINKDNIDKLILLYESPDDVDLTVGGSVEENVPKTKVGPTFLCALMEQFARTRKGDRFWFEHSEENNGFTPDQLAEIRKIRIANLLCNNGNNVKYMQKHAFELITDKNPLINCHAFPKLNLALWKTR